MRRNKTSRKSDAHATYIYFGANGIRYELRPSACGVTEMYIALIHQEDDEEFKSQRREVIR